MCLVLVGDLPNIALEFISTFFKPPKVFRKMLFLLQPLAPALTIKQQQLLCRHFDI